MIGAFICKMFHTSMTRPVRGEYTCLECLRRYPVPWEQPEAEAVELREQEA